MRKLAKTTEVEQQEHDTEGKDFLFPFNFDIYCFIVITFICDINLVVALAFIDFDPCPFRSGVCRRLAALHLSTEWDWCNTLWPS